jgi:hypothetical protein
MLKRLVTFTAVVLAVVPALAYTGQSGNSNCNDNEFWYSSKNCCLPHGGPPSPPPPPPRGNDCPPTGYYWGQSQGCCVPNHPPPENSPPPQCRNGWEWHHSLDTCIPSTPTTPSPPPSQPSGSYGGQTGHGAGNWKRHQKARSVPLCPTGLDACPISGLTTEYECLDTSTELESCGGCASVGQGQDCTAIKGAWNVGCDKGRCKVYTCFAGFLLSADGTSCVSVA